MLLYHLFPVNNWRVVTSEILSELPFEKIIIHVSLPENQESSKSEVEAFFSSYKASQLIFSINSGKGEVDAIRSFITNIDYTGYDILTYMHSKGVTKPTNQHIRNWVRIMHYFVVKRMDICERAFKRGFITYGINKSVPLGNTNGFRGANFFYEGNFVSINLSKIQLSNAVNQLLEDDYYGVEGFWGKLCSWRLGYSPFNSRVNHYISSVPERFYKTRVGRFYYFLVTVFYRLKLTVAGRRSVLEDNVNREV